MATEVDTGKPVWRVTGRRHADGLRQTVFVNATDEASAFKAADGQGYESFEGAWEIDVNTGERLKPEVR